MSTLPLGTNDWQSAAENIQRLRLHNMYLVENPASPDQISRVSRPTLSTPVVTVGDGPIYGFWRQEATFDGDWLVVSDETLYRVDDATQAVTTIGSIPGTEFCQFAGTSDRAVIVRGGVAYSTDGAALTTVLMPDDVDPYAGSPAPVGSVAMINSTFLLSVEGIQRFYWINPGETDPDPLNFASAERLPDAIISISIIGDEIWFIGASGPEVWSSTGDADAPFQRVNGRVYSDGCISRDSAVSVTFNNLPATMWVTDTASVVIAQGQIKKVSNESVEEFLKEADDIRAWTFRHNRHDFYILTTDMFSLAFDLQKGTWSRWDTYELLNWRAHLGIQSRARSFAGDSQSGVIWQLEEGVLDDTLPVIREISGTVDNTGTHIQCSSLYVRVNAGWSPSYDLEPTLEMRWSEDQGVTWTDYFQTSLGAKGRYDQDVIYRSMGLIFRPGRTFEFRFSDPARFRIDYAVLNEAV